MDRLKTSLTVHTVGIDYSLAGLTYDGGPVCSAGPLNSKETKKISRQKKNALEWKCAFKIDFTSLCIFSFVQLFVLYCIFNRNRCKWQLQGLQGDKIISK